MATSFLLEYRLYATIDSLYASVDGLYASIDSGLNSPLVSFIFKIGIGDAFVEYILLLLGIEWTSQKSSVLI